MPLTACPTLNPSTRSPRPAASGTRAGPNTSARTRRPHGRRHLSHARPAALAGPGQGHAQPQRPDLRRLQGAPAARLRPARLPAHGQDGRAPHGPPAVVTNATSRLEQRGLVQRQMSPDDWCVVLATTIPAGRAVADEATAALNQAAFGLPGLTQDQAAQVTAMLHSVLRSRRNSSSGCSACRELPQLRVNVRAVPSRAWRRQTTAPASPRAWCWRSTRAARQRSPPCWPRKASTACSAGWPRRLAHPTPCCGSGGIRIAPARNASRMNAFPGGSYHAVIARILDHLTEAGHDEARLMGAGHRVVHGGERFSASVLVDDEVIAAIRSFVPEAPLHNPANLGRDRGGQRRPARIGAGRRVRHRVPPDHAGPRFPLRSTQGVVHPVRAETLRIPRHKPPFRQPAGRRHARPASRRAAPGHRPSRQRVQRGSGAGRRPAGTSRPSSSGWPGKTPSGGTAGSTAS